LLSTECAVTRMLHCTAVNITTAQTARLSNYQNWLFIETQWTPVFTRDFLVVPMQF